MQYITADGFEDPYHMRNMAGDVIMTIPSELARRLKPRVAALLAEQNMRESGNEGMQRKCCNFFVGWFWEPKMTSLYCHFWEFWERVEGSVCFDCFDFFDFAPPPFFTCRRELTGPSPNPESIFLLCSCLFFDSCPTRHRWAQRKSCLKVELEKLLGVPSWAMAAMRQMLEGQAGFKVTKFTLPRLARFSDATFQFYF
jgi:hypothetical protein